MDDLDLIREFRASRAEPAEPRAAARRRLDAVVAGTDRPVRRRLRWVVAVPATAAVLAAVAVVVPSINDPEKSAATPMVFADALAQYPSDTAADVVSHADRVVVVTALAEAEIPDDAPPARAAAGEGVINRRITFRVDRTLWERPGAQVAPATFDAVWWGWTLHDHQRSKFVGWGAPWIEVGAQYVMPLAHENGTVAPIQPFATFLVGGSAAARAGSTAPSDSVVLSKGQDSALARQLSGATLPAVAEVFEKATP